MLLTDSTFHSDQERREIIPMDMASFPYICRRVGLERYANQTIPWHWHTVFEINCVEEGALDFRTPEQTFTLQKGEAVFVNTGVLHTCRTAGTVPCKYYTHFFDMYFLSGMYNSVFEEKYFQPIARNTALQVWHVRPDSLPRIRMIEAVLRAVELSRTEPQGYEFDLRTELCNFWRLLLSDTETVRASAPIRNTTDTERIKQMMDFINDHCAERLTLEDVAASAGISTRECTRCFRRCIDSSPIAYLTHCRVRMAARLLSESGKGILEISEACGFSSSSYFGKVFRQTMGCTPKEYRRRSS